MLPTFSSRATLFQISRRIDEILLGLAHQLWNLRQALNDVLEAFIHRGVVQDIGRIQGIADQFDIDGRVMPVALHLLDIEPRRLNGIAHDLDIGALFGVQRLGVESVNARIDIELQLDLRFDARRAEVIQLIFKHLPVMPVVAHGAGRHGRQRQGAEHKVIHDLVELKVRGRGAGRCNGKAANRKIQGET